MKRILTIFGTRPEVIKQLLARAWFIVSDSGDIQEEAPSLGKALLVLRENTERPDAIEAFLSDA